MGHVEHEIKLGEGSDALCSGAKVFDWPGKVASE